MSKFKPLQPPIEPGGEKPPKVAGEKPELIKTDVGFRTLHDYCNCPICKTKGRDNGRMSKGALTRIYLKCENCGHGWWADLKIEVVNVNHRLPEPISTR